MLFPWEGKNDMEYLQICALDRSRWSSTCCPCIVFGLLSFTSVVQMVEGITIIHILW